MIKKILRAKGRGLTQTDWLRAQHVFSFNRFYDSERMGVGPLIVLNDDEIAANSGFAAHPHRDMEIVTIVVEGELHHKDSTGGIGILGPEHIQIMSAGTGIVHSEYNGSKHHDTHSIQIWVRPRTFGLPPRYGDYLVKAQMLNEWTTLVAPSCERKIEADVSILRGKYEQAQLARLAPLLESESYFLYVISGEVEIEQDTLSSGDGAIIKNASVDQSIQVKKECDLLLFRLKESD